MDKFIEKYGQPFLPNWQVNSEWQKKFEALHMELLHYPTDVSQAFPILGTSVYMNKDFTYLYLVFLRELIKRGLAHEVTVNDQCFMVRFIRGSSTQVSIHSFGMAVDLNPINNPLGVTREQAIARGLTPFTPEFQQCARDCGLVCGIDFSRPDGMHFENSNW